MKISEMMKCEDVMLEFLKNHPEVTIMLQYDLAAKSWVVGMNWSKTGSFKKVCFLINNESKQPHEELNERLIKEYEARTSDAEVN